jgi:hypothetical protein
MNSDTIKYGAVILLAIAAITCFLPVELYDGYALLSDGTQVDEKLSLSYLFNKSNFIESYANRGVVDIALKPVGWILVGIVAAGLLAALIVLCACSGSAPRKRKSPSEKAKSEKS